MDALLDIYNRITFHDAAEANLKRENANIDGDTAMGTMLKYGSEGSKQYLLHHVLPESIAHAHTNGHIHIHDLDFYMLTETCCQIDLIPLFERGFSTGHGYLRPPQSIESYAALACIVIQSNQNEMHGGQSVPNFDYAMADGVRKTWKKEYDKAYNTCKDLLEPFDEAKAVAYATECADKYTDKRCYQAMEALVHNLNTMHSRAGAQVPFSSLNYGTDTSPEGRMVIRNLLLATEAGLGSGETSIFPVQIFKVKEGVNYNPEDPNYDLFKLAMRVSAKRLFPNFSFLDAPFNKQYYKPNDYNSEVAYMGCRTRVMGNVYDPSREVTCGRGNLSFTTINLPRLGLLAKGDKHKFMNFLRDMEDLVRDQLLIRLGVQSNKKVYNYPFLMGNGIWLDSLNLKWDDTIGEVLKHGTLTMGFIGLAECLVAMFGKHHGESEEAQEFGLEIIKELRWYCDRCSEHYGLNFTLIATPAEGLAGRFVKIDREIFGCIAGVTDREYYTNSFHVPVYYPIKVHQKIDIEAPYHALTNAGHITYVELDGDTTKNLTAFEKIIRYMHDKGIGYGSINHPVDRDPLCGYTGIIGDTCPRCGRHEGEEVSLETLQDLAKCYHDVPKCYGDSDVPEPHSAGQREKDSRQGREVRED